MPSILIVSTPQARPLAEQIQARLNTVPDLAFLRLDDAQAVEQADALLIVIGTDGVEAITADTALLETVESGLGRGDLLALVVLDENAALPPVTELPIALRALAYTGKITLHQDQFDRDVSILYTQLAAHFRHLDQVDQAAVGTSPLTTQRRPIAWNIIILGATALIALLLVTLTQLNERVNNLRLEIIPTATTINIPNREVVLGVAIDLSGETGDGESLLRGVQLALADRPTISVENRRYTVDLLTLDAACSAYEGLQTAELFTSDPVIAGVIGPQCNPGCAAAASTYDSAGYSTVSPTCNDPALTNGQFTSFNRVIPSAAYPGKAAAAYVLETAQIQEIIVIYDELLVGGELAADFSAAYEGQGGATRLFYGLDSATANYVQLAADILDEGVNAVYVAGRPETAANLRAQLPPEIVFFYGGAGNIDSETAQLIELAGTHAEGIITFAALPPDTPALTELASRYLNQYTSEPPSPAFAYGYDAANLLLDGIAATAGTAPDANILIDREALALYLRQAQREGITGLLACDGRGDCAAARVSVRVIRDRVPVEIALQEP